LYIQFSHVPYFFYYKLADSFMKIESMKVDAMFSFNCIITGTVIKYGSFELL